MKSTKSGLSRKYLPQKINQIYNEYKFEKIPIETLSRRHQVVASMIEHWIGKREQEIKEFINANERF